MKTPAQDVISKENADRIMILVEKGSSHFKQNFPERPKPIKDWFDSAPITSAIFLLAVFGTGVSQISWFISTYIGFPKIYPILAALGILVIMNSFINSYLYKRRLKVWRETCIQIFLTVKILNSKLFDDNGNGDGDGNGNGDSK